MALAKLPSSWVYWEVKLGINRRALSAVAETCGRLYAPFVRVRPGKRKRQIDRPIDPLLTVQRRLYRAALRDLPLPGTMHGCVRGRSLLSHVGAHVGQDCVVTLDLRNCFRTVAAAMVFEVWERRLGLAQNFARLMTKLTTWRDALPQGAPTSAALANLAMLPMHEELSAICIARGLRFSQWLDDFALSGDAPERALGQVIQVIKNRGFAVGRAKTKIMRASVPQIVTGMLVNKVVGPAPRLRATTERELRDLARSTGADERAISRARGLLSYCSYASPKTGARLREKARRWGLTDL